METSAERYELLTRLGAGGMAEVFLARLRAMAGFEKIVVVKRLLPHLAHGETSVARFIAEAQLGAQLQHPNIVQTFDFGRVGDEHAIVMEHVRGGSLRDVVTQLGLRGRALSAPLVAFIGRAVCDALRYAHTLKGSDGSPRGVVHRDVSPSNVLISVDGEVKLIDFGVARQTNSEATLPGTRIGKIGYMPPEQFRGEQADARSDVFSCGATLFVALTGKNPFQGRTQAERAHALLSGRYAPIVEARDDVPALLARTVERALRAAPDERFQTATEMWAALDELCEGFGVEASPARLAAVMRGLSFDDAAPAPSAPKTMTSSNVAPSPEAAAATAKLPGPAGTVDEHLLERTVVDESVVATSATRTAHFPEDFPAAPLEVPAPRALVGRSDDLARIDALFSGGARLVTLLGAGGVGKTAVALELHERSRAAGGARVVFCDLSEAAVEADLLRAVGQALGVSLDDGDAAADKIGYALAERASLLVLDNFEQLVSCGGAVVRRWLVLAPACRFLVTSRERLGVEGEAPHRLEPLAVPAPGADPASADAVALFVARARDAGAAVDDDELSDVAQIVRELDGIPLAIELAAARAAVLPPAQMRTRLRDLEAIGAPGASLGRDRHATLRSALEWSWRLLSADEQRALAQCAVFRGGFTADEAEAVLAIPAGAPAVIDLLRALHDKSLLVVRDSESGPRLEMYSSVRDFAEEKLGAADAAALHERHAAQFSAAGGAWAVAVEEGEGRGALPRLRAERENLLAAHARVCASTPTPRSAELAVGLALALEPLLLYAGPLRTWRALLARTAEHASKTRVAPALVARLCEAMSYAASQDGDGEGAVGFCARGEEALHGVDAPEALARVLNARGLAEAELGRTAAARATLGRAAALLDDDANPYVRAGTFTFLGLAHFVDGELATAAEVVAESLRLNDACGARRARGVSRGVLGALQHQLGRLAAARASFIGAVADLAAMGHRRYETLFLCCLGAVEQELGDPESAAAVHRRAIKRARAAGERRIEGIGLALLASSIASFGDVEHAAALFDRAEDRLALVGTPVDGFAAQLLRSHLELAGDDAALRAVAERVQAARALERDPVVRAAPPDLIAGFFVAIALSQVELALERALIPAA